MKTPRDILFQRHRAAESKLDAVSRGVVNQLHDENPSTPLLWLISLPRNFWMEVVWPARRIWIGLAAVWVFILAADLGFQAETPRQIASVSASGGSFVFAFRESELWMSDFTDRTTPKQEQQPEPVPQPPRSQRRSIFVII